MTEGNMGYWAFWALTLAKARPHSSNFYIYLIYHDFAKIYAPAQI
jgi:hypothetical protein